MRWRDSVWAAVRRRAAASGGAFTRADLLAGELAQIVAETGSQGKSPEQTLSRELQELRDAGLLIFAGGDVYRLAEAGGDEADVEAAIRTQVERRVMARVGQSPFRKALLDRWEGRCPLTGISEPGLLRASHIIAWSACADERERLDPENGLLLSALWDAAFDRGLVSFEAGGEPVAFPRLGAAARAALNLEGVPKLGRLSAGNRARLAVHRGWCASGDWPEAAYEWNCSQHRCSFRWET
jgi:hypothetical protein